MLNVQIWGTRIINEGEKSLTLALIRCSQPSRNETQIWAGTSKPQGHASSMHCLFFHLFCYWAFPSWLSWSLNFRTSPKDSAVQSKANGKLTWPLPLCNAVKEPFPSPGCLAGTNSYTAGAAESNRQTQEVFLFIRGKKQELQAWARPTAGSPLGSSRCSFCVCCNHQQHLQAGVEGVGDGAGAPNRARGKMGLPPSLLSVFGHVLGKIG